MQSRTIGDDLRIRPTAAEPRPTDVGATAFAGAALPAVAEARMGRSRRFGLMLRRRWRWVGGMILAGLVVGAIVCQTATPTYTASAQLLIQGSGGTTANRNDSERQAFVHTQEQLITSGAVLAMAASSPGVRELTLLKTESEISGDTMTAMKRVLHVEGSTGDDLLTLSCEATDGREATQLVAAVVDSFVRFETGLRGTGTGGSAAELKREMMTARADWKEKWAALQHFSAEHGLASGDEQIDASNAALHAMALRIATAHVETATAKAAYDEMQRDLQDDRATADRLSALTDDSAYLDVDEQKIDQQIAASNAQLQTYSGHFMANYPAVIVAKHRIADLKLSRAVIVRHRWQAAVRNEQDLQASFADQQVAAAAAQTNQKTFVQLQADAAEAEKQMGIAQARLKALDPADDAMRAIITITDPAHASAAPTSPRVGLILSASAMFGIIIGMLVAMRVDARSITAYSGQENRSIAGMPILTRMPAVQRRHLSMPSADRMHPAAALSAACQTICRKLESIRASGQVTGAGMTVAITSSRPREGKSTLTSLLAATLARQGRRVIVVDANLRNPVLDRLFATEPSVGLAEFLRESDSNGMDFVQASRDGKVAVLTAGEAVDSSHELLNSDRFAQLLADLAHEYEYVLIDAPADAVGVDAQIIAASVDGTIVLANEAMSGRKSLKLLRERLVAVGGNVVGIVLNSGSEPVAPFRRAESAAAEDFATVVPVNVTRRPDAAVEHASVVDVEEMTADAFEAARRVEHEVDAVAEMDFAERIAAEWSQPSSGMSQRIRLPREDVVLSIACAAVSVFALIRGGHVLFDSTAMLKSSSMHVIDSTLWLGALLIVGFISRKRTGYQNQADWSIGDAALTLFAQVSVMAAGLIILSGRNGASPATLMIAAMASSIVGICLSTLWIAPMQSSVVCWISPMIVALIGYVGMTAGTRLPGSMLLHGAVRALSSPTPVAYASLGTLGALIGALIGRVLARAMSEMHTNGGGAVAA